MTDTQACDRMKAILEEIEMLLGEVTDRTAIKLAWFQILHEQMRLELKQAREVLGV